jgi:hypothetical protein
VDEFDDEPVGNMGQGRPGPRGWLPRVALPQMGPALVTLTVLCAGIALLVSSVIWHPHG